MRPQGVDKSIRWSEGQDGGGSVNWIGYLYEQVISPLATVLGLISSSSVVYFAMVYVRRKVKYNRSAKGMREGTHAILVVQREMRPALNEAKAFFQSRYTMTRFFCVTMPQVVEASHIDRIVKDLRTRIHEIKSAGNPFEGVHLVMDCPVMISAFVGYELSNRLPHITLWQYHTTGPQESRDKNAGKYEYWGPLERFVDVVNSVERALPSP